MALYDVSVSTFVTIVNRYTNRSYTADLDATTGLIPLMVIGKRRIENDLQVREQETTLSLTGSQLPYTFSDDYISIKEIIMNGDTVLQPVGLTDLRLEQDANSGSEPSVYNVTALSLDVGPSARTGDTFEVVYHAREAEDYTLNTTDSIYIKYYLDLWLAATLVEVYQTVQDMERSMYWEGMYQKRLLEAERRNGKAAYSGYPLYVREV